MTDDLFGSSGKVLTVAELTRAIRGTLETRFGAVWVQGEISNYKQHPSGHQYFTLKDQRAQISCVIFRNTLPPTARPLSEGAQVQIYGNLSVFEARGQYQLSVQTVQARGVGLLQAKFEALKRKLEAEGLFAAERKRPLPKFPRRVGIVTSPSGAAIRDMLNVLQRRAPSLQILINPVRVQGTGAAAEIAVAIRELTTPNDSWAPLDLVVITRGGGSIEDLWEFNEEIVARAIADSTVPVVSAVGHEVDFTIADFVADLRAPTPSAAAELIVPDAADLARRVNELAVCLDRHLRNFVAHGQARLRFLTEKTLARELLQRMRDAQQRIDLARESLTQQAGASVAKRQQLVARAAQVLQTGEPSLEIAKYRGRLTALARLVVTSAPRSLALAQQRFRRIEAMLRVLGPEATLRRGYSITTLHGKVLRSVAVARPGEGVMTRLLDGAFASKIVDRRE
ncbi:MAG: exodeoxyribonuclease VII large subunit [Verrucomicrobiota bacterium]|nr:exodeoxyribonuclease VII large subunit [Verrucomicrobiota bacterium]